MWYQDEKLKMWTSWIVTVVFGVLFALFELIVQSSFIVALSIWWVPGTYLLLFAVGIVVSIVFSIRFGICKAKRYDKDEGRSMHFGDELKKMIIWCVVTVVLKISGWMIVGNVLIFLGIVASIFSVIYICRFATTAKQKRIDDEEKKAEREEQIRLDKLEEQRFLNEIEAAKDHQTQKNLVVKYLDKNDIDKVVRLCKIDKSGFADAKKDALTLAPTGLSIARRALEAIPRDNLYAARSVMYYAEKGWPATYRQQPEYIQSKEIVDMYEDDYYAAKREIEKYEKILKELS